MKQVQKHLLTWILGIAITSIFTQAMAQSPTQPIAELMIVEIMNNPFSVSDDQGEWFELYNPTDQAVDLNGWIIADLDNDADTIQSEQPLLIPPKGFFVLANQANLALNGGVIANYAYDGHKFILANRSDEIILKNPAGVVIDEVVYTTIDFPIADGSSMFFAGVSTDDNQDGKRWKVTEKRYSTAFVGNQSSDKGSPGTYDILQEKLVDISPKVDSTTQVTASSKLSKEFFKSMNNFISPIIYLSNLPVTEYQGKALESYLSNVSSDNEVFMFGGR